jgi:hypothetical protein
LHLILAPIAGEREVRDPFPRNLRKSVPRSIGAAPADGSREGRDAVIHRDGENRAVDLGRIAWLVTTFACMVAVLILLIKGYYGYAGVTLAVAVSAAINLT